MKIELNEPTMPKGMPFHVNGLGTLENGKAVEFSKEQIDQFEAEQGRTVREAFKANPNVTIESAKGGDD